MSFKTFFAGAAAFLAGLENSASSVPGISDLKTTLATAETQAKALVPAIANDVVNAALAKIPGGLGATAAPFVDDIIDEAIAQLVLKKSTTVTAAGS